MTLLRTFLLVSLSISTCPTYGSSSVHSSSCRETTVSLFKNFFSGCTYPGYGGAVTCTTLDAEESCFRNCSVLAGFGGAIYIYGYDQASFCSRLVAESCSAYGAGFMYSEGPMACEESQCFNCIAQIGYYGAIGYERDSSSATSNFTSCYAAGFCGAINFNSGSSRVSSCIFVECSDGSRPCGAICANSRGPNLVIESIFLNCQHGPGGTPYSGSRYHLAFERCGFEASEFVQSPPGNVISAFECLFSGQIQAFLSNRSSCMSSTRAISGLRSVVLIADACWYVERLLMVGSPHPSVSMTPSAILAEADAMRPTAYPRGDGSADEVASMNPDFAGTEGSAASNEKLKGTCTAVGSEVLMDSEAPVVGTTIIETKHPALSGPYEASPLLDGPAEAGKSKVGVIVGVTFAILAVLAVLVLLWIYWRRRAPGQSGEGETPEAATKTEQDLEMIEDHATQVSPLVESEEVDVLYEF